jgi:hypothetical protein
LVVLAAALSLAAAALTTALALSSTFFSLSTPLATALVLILIVWHCFSPVSRLGGSTILFHLGCILNVNWTLFR